MKGSNFLDFFFLIFPFLPFPLFQSVFFCFHSLRFLFFSFCFFSFLSLCFHSLRLLFFPLLSHPILTYPLDSYVLRQAMSLYYVIKKASFTTSEAHTRIRPNASKTRRDTANFREAKNTDTLVRNRRIISRGVKLT